MAFVVLTSGDQFDKQHVHIFLQRTINKVYKLLPLREQGEDWQKALENIIQELSGLHALLRNVISVDIEQLFLLVLIKLKGLFYLSFKDNFMVYRRTIFQVLNLLSTIDGVFHEKNS